MSGLKTITLSFLIFLLGSVGARVAADQALLTSFSVCAGRVSAQLEHQWLLQDPQAQETERVRDGLRDVIGALVTDADRVHALGLRIEAKQAQAVLLRQASFGTDRARARWAADRARAQVVGCTALVAFADSPEDAVPAFDMRRDPAAFRAEAASEAD